jgi:hypothetical protein
MLMRIGVMPVIGSVLLLAACGSQAGTASRPASSNPSPIATLATPVVASATTAAAASGAPGTPATNPLSWVAGTVTSVSDGKVTVSDGSSFTIDPQRSVSRLTPATMADLQPGSVVAITGKRQPDNTMQASLVRIIATAPSATFFGQSALDKGNLMTNATVDKVAASSFTVTFPGGGAQVTMAPGGEIARTVSGTQSDVKAGATVYAQVRADGVSQVLSVR